MTAAIVALAVLALLSAGLSAYLTLRQRRLLREAAEREVERERLADQLITAEQDERRRLALFLHDGPVQSLSGIALLLDGVDHAISSGQTDQARSVLRSALDRHRETIRELRDLSFNLEPVVLRDQGFSTAVRALGEELGLSHRVQIDVDVEAAERLGEKTQAALYQIIREALNGAIRRGPPTRIAVRVEPAPDGGLETIVSDDAPGERRRATFDALAERARTLNGRFARRVNDHGEEFFPGEPSWSENDLAQAIARQPGGRAWFELGRDALERPEVAEKLPYAQETEPLPDGGLRVRVYAAVTHTYGGIEVDTEARAADGVWVAGVDAGGVANGGYASGLAQALVLGLVAAESVYAWR